jgi:hypothetical protein
MHGLCIFTKIGHWSQRLKNMDCPQIFFREHAVKRMFERGITSETVEDILSNGEIIREYPDDKPFPSFLLLGYEGERPIHVLAARDSETCYVITVYEPDPEIWQKGFKIKKL